jgi:hypothetical protein
MTQLAPMTLDNGAVIYIEIPDDVVEPNLPLANNFGEETRDGEKGATEEIMKQFQAMKGTIATYTQYTLDAFTDIARANIDKVTLEFGIQVTGELGVPYVTKGSAESNLKITVECSFPNK